MLHSKDLSVIDGKPPAVLANHEVTVGFANDVTDGQAAHASHCCNEERRNETKNIFECEISGNHKKPLVRNRQADDSKYQQEKYSPVSVVQDPLDDCLSRH